MTDEEEERKDQLDGEGGFGDWGKRQFQAFIRGCEQFGRYAYDKIATEVSEKSAEEVAAYGKVFWKRYQELPGMPTYTTYLSSQILFFGAADWEKQIKKIDDAEDRRKNQNHSGDLLRQKIDAASHPLLNLAIPYASQ